MSTPADTFTDRTDATNEEFQARVAVFDAAEAAPESFDAVAACRRVLELAEAIGRGEVGPLTQDLVRALIYVAVHDSTAALRGDRGKPATVAHNHTRFRNDAGPWSPCPVSCPAAGLLR